MRAMVFDRYGDPDVMLVLGCNGTSRETCRNKFKKEKSKPFGRVAKESESGRARTTTRLHDPGSGFASTSGPRLER